MAERGGSPVVVVTGASSGIGRATAHAFARQGAAVVLAARSEGALRDAARECERLGGRPLVVVTDVTQETQVESLARTAVETFGRLDVWVNNAGVMLYGQFDQPPLELYRQVLEVNFYGCVYGARAALRQFRRQRHGVLINNASVAAVAPMPYCSAYVASKSAVRGFSSSLRMELAREPEHDIHVCTVLPDSIDTPLFQHAGNFFGRRAKALDPVHSAESVAARIVSLAKRPRREAIVGAIGYVRAAQAAFTPAIYEATTPMLVEHDQFRDEPSPPTGGNLLEPMPELSGVSGGWETRPAVRALGYAALGAAVLMPVAILWAWQRSRNGQGAGAGLTQTLAEWTGGHAARGNHAARFWKGGNGWGRSRPRWPERIAASWR